MSGFYIGVDGKARKVKGGYIGIDGKARKIKKGYIGDENGIARLCWSGSIGDPVFANNTWDVVIAACQARAVPDTWAVGDQKTMTINNKDYIIDIIGNDHDDYADGSGKAPLTFQMHDTYEYVYGMAYSASNNGGWNNCTIRKDKLPEILKAMPSEVKAAIKQVNKLTSEGHQGSGIVTTADKLFLLSEVEVFGTATKSVTGEGRRYAYYENGNSTQKGNGVNGWWLRSPSASTLEQFCYINANGLLSTANANGSRSVSFAFCF